MVCILYITFKDEDEARKVARHLLDKGFIACANIFPINSIYRWEGRVNEDKEIAGILKTKDELVDALIDEVRSIHSYQTPCILSLRVEKGNPDFLNWVEDECYRDVK